MAIFDIYYLLITEPQFDNKKWFRLLNRLSFDVKVFDRKTVEIYVPFLGW
jgi:hypothetical protein